MKKIAITMGDPNGISPEIIIKSLNFLDLPQEKVVLVANKKVFDFYEQEYNLVLEKNYNIIEVPYEYSNIKPGKETQEAGEFAFKTIVTACNMAINNEIEAIVTAPVSKIAMKMAGHNYNGQTEILEQYLAMSGQNAEMLFICDKFSVFLLTRHIALKNVFENIKKDNIIKKTENLVSSLKNQLGIVNPKIAVCALNPHSGENGMFGDEELLEIKPAIDVLKNRGINIEGPFPSDTLFSNCSLDDCNYDCYIAMYHDQGLIPIKLLEQNNCVNTTIGLNIIRTSPAHGTAFDIAGKNMANASSMISAINLALK